MWRQGISPTHWRRRKPLCHCWVCYQFICLWSGCSFWTGLGLVFSYVFGQAEFVKKRFSYIFGKWHSHFFSQEIIHFRSVGSSRAIWGPILPHCHKGPIQMCLLVAIGMFNLKPNRAIKSFSKRLLGVNFNSLPKSSFLNMLIATHWHVQCAQSHVFLLYICMLILVIGSNCHGQNAAFW